MPSLLLPAPTAGKEPLIVNQLKLIPATLKLPAEGQLHRLDGAHQGIALGFTVLAAVDVFRTASLLSSRHLPGRCSQSIRRWRAEGAQGLYS